MTGRPRSPARCSISLATPWALKIVTEPAGLGEPHSQHPVHSLNTAAVAELAPSRAGVAVAYPCHNSRAARNGAGAMAARRGHLPLLALGLRHRTGFTPGRAVARLA